MLFAGEGGEPFTKSAWFADQDCGDVDVCNRESDDFAVSAYAWIAVDDLIPRRRDLEG